MVNKNILSKFDNNLTLQYFDGWMKNNRRENRALVENTEHLYCDFGIQVSDEKFNSLYKSMFQTILELKKIYICSVRKNKM